MQDTIFDITLNSVKEEGATINKQDILDMGEKHIAVVRETTTVKTYGDILYISDDVTMGPDDRTATVTKWGIPFHISYLNRKKHNG